MTIEEITQTLQRVAENQARHDEMHARHSADVAEIDKMIAANAESLNRHDRQLDRLFEIVGVLGERQVENDKRFAELAEANRRAGERVEKLEGSYELLESFVRDFREESRDYFAQTDRKLAALADLQAATAGLVAGFVKETNGRFVETDGQIKALIAAQTRTDEQIRHLIERNGSSGAKKAKAKKAKKPSKKGAK
jgi:DNA repair exonuclease SbcCD ATPase subunit